MFLHSTSVKLLFYLLILLPNYLLPQQVEFIKELMTFLIGCEQRRLEPKSLNVVSGLKVLCHSIVANGAVKRT